MTATALLDRIGNVFVHHLNIQAPSPDIELIESGTIDSLTFVELLAHLEREFSIRIPLENLDLNQFRSIERISDFIQAKLESTEVAPGQHSRV
jgi:methoxymalonate biosynthesis acyl carrier protein